MTGRAVARERFAGHVNRIVAAADRLQVERPVPEGNECFTQEAVVLYALASEIGLKALVSEERGCELSKVRKLLPPSATGGHDLLELFNLLSAEVQRSLELRLRRDMPTTQEHVIAIDFDKPSDQVITADVFGSGSDLRKTLATVRQAFEAWRYAYEHGLVGPTNVTLLRAFAVSVESELRDGLAT